MRIIRPLFEIESKTGLRFIRSPVYLFQLFFVPVGMFDMPCPSHLDDLA